MERDEAYTFFGDKCVIHAFNLSTTFDFFFSFKASIGLWLTSTYGNFDGFVSLSGARWTVENEVFGRKDVVRFITAIIIAWDRRFYVLWAITIFFNFRCIKMPEAHIEFNIFWFVTNVTMKCFFKGQIKLEPFWWRPFTIFRQIQLEAVVAVVINTEEGPLIDNAGYLRGIEGCKGTAAQCSVKLLQLSLLFKRL